MRILLVNTRYFPEAEAGPAFSVQALAEDLARAGHQVHVACLGRDAQTAVDLHRGVAIHRFAPGTDPMHAGELLNRLLARLKPDVVHTHWVAGFPLAQLGPIIKGAGIRLVHSLREYRFLCGNGTLFREDRGACRTLCSDCGAARGAAAAFARQVDAVIGVSRFCLDRHLEAGLFESADTRCVIRTGYRGPEQPLPMPAEDDATLRLGYLGRISTSKGLPWLLSELARSELQEQVALTVAGAPPDGFAADVEQELPRLAVDWMGYAPATALLERIDWLVVPSLCYDVLPRVVIEAFAHGVPVVASRLGGIPEMIAHGRNGRLFDPSVDGDLLKELGWIDEHRGQWATYRTEAWQSRHRFQPDRSVQAHLQVYRKSTK